MKIFLLHIILFSYAIVLVKPVMPYVADGFAHLLYYKQHMATVHFENGKYHVHAEALAASKESNNGKGLPSQKKEDPVSEHISKAEKPVKHIIVLQAIRYQSGSCAALTAGMISNNYPPPKFQA